MSRSTSAPCAGACGLDRGELDKVIERASAAMAPAGGGRDERRDQHPPPRYEDDRRYQDDRRYEQRDRYDRDRDDDRYDKRRKKRSFLDDIFDFG